MIRSLTQVSIFSLVLSANLICDAAIDIIFDYSYDTDGYFTNERKYIVEQAAYAFESRLNSESFASLNPDDYGSTNIDFYVSAWNPQTLSTIQLRPDTATSEGNLVGAADTVLIALGAKAVGTSNQYLAAATGSFGYGSHVPNGTFLDYWDNTRNSTSNFDSVGGSITVNSSFSFYEDTDLTTHTDATTSGLVDFYSVMTHEIGHIMGFADTWDAWNNNLSGNFWTGANGKAEYNNQNIPIDSASKSHFGTLSQGNVNCACHPLMSTSTGTNTRRGFSELDFALLKDIGYNISASPEGTNIGGTYTDPDWGGSYYIPVSESYAFFLDPTLGSAAPEPAIVFPILGLATFGFLTIRNSRKSKQTG